MSCVTSQAFHGHGELVGRKVLSWFRSPCLGGYPDIWIEGVGQYMLEVDGKDCGKDQGGALISEEH